MILQKAKIPVPRHIVIDRDHLKDGEEVSGLVEQPDCIQYEGKTLYKPFVEKPASGDDHNVYIYYPEQMVRMGTIKFESDSFCLSLLGKVLWSILFILFVVHFLVMNLMNMKHDSWACMDRAVV